MKRIVMVDDDHDLCRLMAFTCARAIPACSLGPRGSVSATKRLSMRAGSGALLARLTPMAEQLHEASRRFRAVVWAAVYSYEVNPALTVSPDAASSLAALGLPLDLDIYCLAGAE